MLQHTLSLPWKTIRRLRSTDWTLLPCHDATGRLRNRLLIRPSPKYPDQTESSGATLCSFFTYSLVNFSYLGERSLVLCHELRKVRTIVVLLRQDSRLLLLSVQNQGGL